MELNRNFAAKYGSVQLMEKDGEKYCKTCYGCQLGRPPGPIRTKTFPPWGVLAIDLLGPLPINETISVVVDYYSRYYEINILRSTVASRVISSLQDMFARHGLHESVASNNGTRFTTTEFTEYMVQQGIRYHKVTGKWPQANEEGAC